MTPDRKPTDKRGFRRKKDAEDWLAENTVALNSGTWRPAAAGKITVNEAAKAWLDAKKPSLAPKTESAYQDALNRIEKIGRLGRTQLLNVNHETIEQWISDLCAYEVRPGRTMAAKTVRNTYSVLSSVMKRAVRDKRIASNPCTDIDLPKVTKAEQTILTPAEVEIMANAAGKYSDMVRALAMAGFRWGELAGLQVQDVDLPNRRINVNRQITENKGKLVHGLPKHDKKRTVPIIGPLTEILERRTADKPQDALVFTTLNNTVLRGSNSRKAWFDEAAETAGHPELTPHDLRHTFASVAISSGVNVKALQLALGHHSAAFTLDEYGHLYPEDLDAFISVMGDSFSVNYGQNMGTNEKTGHDG